MAKIYVASSWRNKYFPIRHTITVHSFGLEHPSSERHFKADLFRFAARNHVKFVPNRVCPGIFPDYFRVSTSQMQDLQACKDLCVVLGTGAGNSPTETMPLTPY